MVMQHLFPVFALVLLGVVLKRVGLTQTAFLATADRLVYYIFFPLLLFWKIGAASQSFSAESMRLYLAVVSAVAVIYLLSLLSIKLFKIPDFKAGAFSQSCYRFNTYIGMAVVVTALGDKGVARFGILIGMLIPVINVLAVTTLIWFCGQSWHWRRRIHTTARSLVTNPLIIGCAAGLLYARWFNGFPTAIENTLRLGASITLPLALLSIGGSLTIASARPHLGLASAAAGFKLAALPVAGYWIMRWFAVSANLLPVGMIFFGLPTSTAIYILSAQLNSDTQYASAAIVLSTGASFLSLSIILWWLHG
jgi:malonate transporter and related proteins